MYHYFFKRLLDIFFSMLALLLLSPVFIIVTVLLLIYNRGKPFFRQARPGRNENIFSIIKFRTMNNRKDAEGNLLPDGERLTAIGRLVRKNSLDELPQMINVLKGEMSMVGPRPLLPEYLPLYSNIQRRRHLVRPGITGWAQVNGRNAISWDEKFTYDIAYIDRLSFTMDMKILIMTLKKVFISEGITAEGQATTKAFTGNQ